VVFPRRQTCVADMPNTHAPRVLPANSDLSTALIARDRMACDDGYELPLPGRVQSVRHRRAAQGPCHQHDSDAPAKQ
jgi:hypothetical protein